MLWTHCPYNWALGPHQHTGKSSPLREQAGTPASWPLHDRGLELLSLLLPYLRAHWLAAFEAQPQQCLPCAGFLPALTQDYCPPCWGGQAHCPHSTKWISSWKPWALETERMRGKRVQVLVLATSPGTADLRALSPASRLPSTAAGTMLHFTPIQIISGTIHLGGALSAPPDLLLLGGIIYFQVYLSFRVLKKTTYIILPFSKS